MSDVREGISQDPDAIGERVPVLVVLLFAVQVCVAVAILLGLGFLLWTADFSLDLVVSSLVIAGFIAPIPALIWGFWLRAQALKGTRLTIVGHLRVALLVGLIGIPAYIAFYYLALFVIRQFLDSRFDALGFFFVFAMLGATGLLIMLPLLSLAFRWSARHLGVGQLFPEAGPAVRRDQQDV